MSSQIKCLKLDLSDTQLFRSWIFRRLMLNQSLAEGTQIPNTNFLSIKVLKYKLHIILLCYLLTSWHTILQQDPTSFNNENKHRVLVLNLKFFFYLHLKKSFFLVLSNLKFNFWQIVDSPDRHVNCQPDLNWNKQPFPIICTLEFLKIDMEPYAQITEGSTAFLSNTWNLCSLAINLVSSAQRKA